MNTTQTQKKLYTTKEVCEMTSLSRSTVEKATKTGELRRIKIGKSVRFRPEALEQWLVKRERR